MTPSPFQRLWRASWVAVAFGLLFFPRPTPTFWRGPASSSPDCQDLFTTFCQDADLPISTDPTGEVWSENEAFDRLQTLRKTLSPQKLMRTLYSDRRVLEIRRTERWVRQEILRWIERQMSSSLNLRDRKELRQRILAVRLEIPSSLPQSPELLVHGAFYESHKQGRPWLSQIRLGGAYVLGTTSQSNWVFTLAHEFAHSIDPCELRASGWTPPALEKLNGCLLGSGVVQMPNDRHECLTRDQLSEVFADWLATEILVAWLEHYGKEYPTPQRWALVRNSVRDLCPPPNSDFDSEWHPETRTRINRILGENAKIRNYLGCPPSEQKTCRTDDQ